MMARLIGGKAKLSLVGNQRWVFDVEPYSRMPVKTLHDVRDDLRLKRALKRAVKSEFAPQPLIDTIRKRIRG